MGSQNNSRDSGATLWPKKGWIAGMVGHMWITGTPFYLLHRSTTTVEWVTSTARNEVWLQFMISTLSEEFPIVYKFSCTTNLTIHDGDLQQIVYEFRGFK